MILTVTYFFQLMFAYIYDGASGKVAYFERKYFTPFLFIMD